LSKDSVFCQAVFDKALAQNLRVGESLVQHLNIAIEDLGFISGSDFDPFYWDLSYNELCRWVSNHLIFDDELLLAVVNDGEILWSSRRLILKTAHFAMSPMPYPSKKWVLEVDFTKKNETKHLLIFEGWEKAVDYIHDCFNPEVAI